MKNFLFQWAVSTLKVSEVKGILYLSDSVIFKELTRNSVLAGKWLAWLKHTHKSPEVRDGILMLKKQGFGTEVVEISV